MSSFFLHCRIMKKFLLLIILTKSFCCFSQEDVQVVLHENVINKVLKAIGNISDTSQFRVMFFKGAYKWTVIDPAISLKANGQAEFKCDVEVEAGFIRYRNAVIGDAGVNYDKAKNLISVKITHGIFEVYTRVLGVKMHIANIDLAEYLTDPMTFEGPLTLTTSMEFTMPDNTKKTIYAVPEECDLVVVEHKIIVNCEVGFTDKDPSKK